MKKEIHSEKCHVCGYETKANLLARHIKCKHGQEEYLIYKKYLDNRMQNIKQEQHKKVLFNTKNKILSCPYCDRKEVNLKILKYHVQTCHFNKYQDFLNDILIEKNIKEENHKKQCLQNSSKNYKCQYCNEEIPSKQFPHHLKFIHGLQAYLKFKQNYENDKLVKSQENKKEVKCPYCGQNFYALGKHILYKHNKTIVQFKKEFPDLRLQANKRHELEINCEFCNKKFKFNNSYVIHLKKMHPTQFKSKQKQEKEEKYKHFQCKICHKKVNQIYQHVYQSHNDISWQEYCEKFFHNKNDKTYFSLEHRKNLSKSRLKNGISQHPNKSYYFFIEDERYPKILRSYEQFKIITILLNEGIIFEYEKNIIKWLDYNKFEHNYIVDLKINDEFYEIKGCSNKRIENIKKQEKYLKVNEILSKKNKYLHFINIKTFLDQFNLNKNYNQQFFLEKIKLLLKQNKILIKYFLPKNIKHQPRLFKNLDKNYKTNKKLIIIGQK